MCQFVTMPDGEEVYTVAELRKIWPVILGPRGQVIEKEDDEDYCLCPVDIPGTAAANGGRVVEDEPWGYFIFPGETT